jgi:Cu(I)/Ag(I) efflux system protein CusF
MKALVVTSLALLAAGFSVSGVAADRDHAAMHAQTTADSPLAEGVVKKVDKAAGKVTLTHGPLPNGMPAMTMAYRVRNAAWIDQIKEGQKIRFAADQVNGATTLVRFEPAQ